MNLWKALDGWKTAIAAVYWPLIDMVLPIWFPAGEPPMMHRIVLTIGVVLTVAGVGHKAWKATRGQDFVEPEQPEQVKPNA